MVLQNYTWPQNVYENMPLEFKCKTSNSNHEWTLMCMVLLPVLFHAFNLDEFCCEQEQEQEELSRGGIESMAPRT